MAALWDHWDSSAHLGARLDFTGSLPGDRFRLGCGVYTELDSVWISWLLVIRRSVGTTLIPVASFTKNKSPAAITFVLKTDGGILNSREKK